MTRKLLRYLGIAILLGCAVQVGLAQSQIAVTGHIAAAGPNPSNPTIYQAQFTLAYCGANVPRVFGTGTIAASTATYTADPTTGLVAGTIWGNDVITCGGVAGNTRYNVSFVTNGSRVGPVQCFDVIGPGPFNLDTAQPCAIVPPPTPPPGTQDAHVNNLTVDGLLAGTNARFSGDVTALTFHFLTAGAHFTCPGGSVANSLLQDFTLGCTPQATSPVTSVFGRTGAVTAQNNDYSFIQIAGQIADGQFQAITHVYPIQVTESTHLTATPTHASCNVVSGQALSSVSADNAANVSCTHVGVAVGNLQFASSSSGCTITTPSSYDTCTVSVTWPTPFPNNTYQVNCFAINPFDTGNASVARAVLNGTTSTGKTTTGVVVVVSSQGTSSGNVGVSGVDCIAVE